MEHRKTAVVTGAGGGIGEAVVRQLLDQGYGVLAVDRRPCPIEHGNVINFEVDLTDRDAVRQAAEQIAEHTPTTLVHNAGVVRSALLEDMQLEDLDELVELYLASTILLTQSCLPAMKSARFGRVVIVSSRAAVGLATRTAYSATKSGQFGLARTWALELGPHGITVNVVAPGPVSTKMFTDVITPGSEREQKLIASLPMRRIGTPEDIARAVMFFADERNSFITGQALFVCGGASVGFLQI